MSVIHVTSRPSYHAERELEAQAILRVLPDPLPCGTLSARFAVGGLRDGLMTLQQKRIERAITKALGEKPQYIRQYNHSDDRGYYTWKSMTLRQNRIETERFPITHLEKLLSVFRSLDAMGWYPNREILLTYYLEKGEVSTLYNLTNIIESRRALIEEALSLQDDLSIIINESLALSITLGAFSYTAVEAAAFLMEQACKMALSTGRARMKPCDMSNPKYQMRTWLLRLGFIGEQYERPRRTLLEALAGDSAFFTEEQKKEAVTRRKAMKLNKASVCFRT